MNRKERRAQGERGPKFDPAGCDKCVAYFAVHEEEIKRSCAPVALELGVLPDEAVVMFMAGFHNGDHDPNPTVSEEHKRGAGPTQN